MSGVSASDLSAIRDEVVRLRCQGHSYDYIQTATGLSYKRVSHILNQEFVERCASREDMRVQAALELDYLRRELWREWEQATNKGTARWAAECILKAWDQKRRLFALDDPVRVNVQHSIEEMSLEEVEAELVRINPTAALPPAVPVDSVADAEITIREEETVDGP